MLANASSILLALLLIATPLHSMSLSAAHETANWRYEWQSPLGQQRGIQLHIDEKTREKAYLGEGDLLDYRKISDMIFRQMKEMANNLSNPSVRISIKGTSMADFYAQAWTHPAMQEEGRKNIEAIYDFAEQAMEPVELHTYYRFNKQSRSLGIEYNKIAADYQSLVIQTLLALSQSLQTDNRESLRDGLLDMLQSLPYTDLKADDFPLLNPARMLLEKRGDCESKQVFMATALKLLFPDRRVWLLPLPEQEHIVLSYQDERGEDILMDATGPARLAAGSLSKDTHLHEKVNRYEILL